MILPAVSLTERRKANRSSSGFDLEAFLVVSAIVLFYFFAIGLIWRFA
jgi:hypothetical protein